MSDRALLNLNDETRKLLRAYLKNAPDGLYEWSMRKVEVHHTDRQRKYYHGCVLVHLAAGLSEAWGEKTTKDDAHEWVKREFLGRRVVNKRTGVEDVLPGTTKKLTTEGYADLIDRIIVWAADYLNTEIPPADKYYAQSKRETANT
jgi:hypothetical protein